MNDTTSPAAANEANRPAATPDPPAATAAPGGQPQQIKLEISTSRQFNSWMAEHRVSLAFTTYQTHRLFLIGLKPDGMVSLFERNFTRCMGLWSDGQTMWMSSLYQLWRFENALQPGQTYNGFDRCYVPRMGYTTGDLDVHDIAVDAQGRPIFVATLFGCLATLSPRHSFQPLWKPPFITKIAAEDRCHLNGLAMENGKPRYVTAVSETDITDAWREKRESGGVVIDVQTNQVVARGLSMPHSPRVHQGRIWLMNSGSGQIGWIDPKIGKFEPVAFVPGYLRGMAIVGDFAIIGMSKARQNKTFSGLKLDDELKRHGVAARCGLMVLDMRSGDLVHWLRIEGGVEELYDVVVLPGVTRPAALGFKSDEIRRFITIGGQGRGAPARPKEPPVQTLEVSKVPASSGT